MFINMDLDADDCEIFYFVQSICLDQDAINHVLGNLLDQEGCSKIKFNDSHPNLWVWYLSSIHNKISSAVYNHCNRNIKCMDSWSKWVFLWRLRVSSKIKFFCGKSYMGDSKLSTIFIGSIWALFNIVVFVSQLWKLYNIFCGNVVRLKAIGGF